MLDRIYVEITNICNLNCSFCPKTKRQQRLMTEGEFECICQKIQGKTKAIFLHVLGEPLLHPALSKFLGIAKKYNIKVCITTNGTLVDKCENIILDNSDIVHRISISLHCKEGNDEQDSVESYLEKCISFAKKASYKGIYCVFRLWNIDSNDAKGKNDLNSKIEDILRANFDTSWQERWSGFRLEKNIFLEYAGTFVWPKDSELTPEDDGTCHGLIDQIAILCDGTVVPCCLDGEGKIPLGNIFNSSIEEILSSPLAIKMKKGFEEKKMLHPLCKSCSYARRFK